jgi:hypothetical protein
MKKYRCQHVLALTLLLAASAPAKTIIVNTADNTDFSAGQTNLVTAINALADGDSINFNIPGAGVHYLLTPPDGYPLITKNSITIDGYSQPTAVPNSNPIHAPNNAQLKIVLTSTNGGALSMQTAVEAFAGHPFNNLGFGPDEQAILGFFRSTNVWVKGLCIQASHDSNGSGIAGTVKSIAFCSDAVQYEPWPNATCGNWHVSGCWFGLNPATGQVAYMPDGVALATPRIAIAAYRTRDDNGSNAQYPQPGVIGVAAGSSNPRAEFNVFVTGYGFDAEGLNFRISGNFFNVLPDGMHNVDICTLNSGLQQEDGYIEIGRSYDNTLIGTDGDGVNDADEGNVFGGGTAYIPGGGLKSFFVADLYSGNGTNVVIAGNYWGVAIDGVTRFTNSMVFLHSLGGSAKARVGSDFDGVSDALEANLLYNNYPFSTMYPSAGSLANGALDYRPVTFFDGTGTKGYGGLNPGAQVSFRGNVSVGNGLLPDNYATALGTGLLLTPFTNACAPYMSTAGDVIPSLATTNIFPHLKGTFPVGTAGFSTVVIDVYELDQEGWANGQIFIEPELTDLLTFTNGFAQGKKYLGSYAVPNTGSFDIILPPNSGLVTVTANYSADPAGTHNGRVHTSNFSNPAYIMPSGVASVGLTQVVPDVPMWYDNTANGGAGGVKLGPIVPLANQWPDNGTWEPWVSAVGEKDFLILAGKFADDSTVSNQRYSLAIQPATAGTYANGKLGEGFYDDSFNRYTNNISSRNNGNPPRVYGDRRYGAVNFATGGESNPQDQGSFFNSDGRFSAVMYTGVAGQRCDLVQTFSLNPSTLVQTPLTKAFDCNSLGHPEFATRTDVTQQQRGRFGGGIAALDNGNFVALMDDRSPFFPGGNPGNEAIAAIFTPAGGVVKASWLIAPNEAWTDPTGFKGGFCIRVGIGTDGALFFFDNAGNPTATNYNNLMSGLSMDTGRGDGTKICGDIRSPYVYCAGTGSGKGWITVWNGTTGAYITKYQFNDDLDPANAVNRTDVACDSLGNVCVAWDGKPVGGGVFANNQILARTFHFDGKTVTPTTHTFFPFTSHDHDVNNVLGFKQENSNVEMTTRYICIASKGLINSTNNAASGPDSAAQTTVYTVINNPGAVAPVMTATHSGSNLLISWDASAGDCTLQSTPLVKPTAWADVSPQPASVVVNGNTYQKTVPIGAGKLFFRLKAL